MTAKRERPAAELFNNPIFSDIVIKQVSKDGQVREYFAHKAVLYGGSRYFVKALTDQEASEAVMEMHDDDPDHFEFVFKYMYTQIYDKVAIEKMVGENTDTLILDRVLVSTGIDRVADKHDISTIREHIAEDIGQCLATTADSDWCTIVRAHYSSVVTADSLCGNLLVSAILKHFDFAASDKMMTLMKAHPVFGADVALALHRKEGVITAATYYCQDCQRPGIVDAAELHADEIPDLFCGYCGNSMDFDLDEWQRDIL